MPVDAYGNRAEIIKDGDSTIKRMNVGRLYEQYVNATSRHVSEHVRALVQRDQWQEAHLYLMDYYKVASPLMWDIANEVYAGNELEQRKHVESVCKEGVYLYLPPNSPNVGAAQARALRKHFPIPIGPVTYRGRSGRVVTTKSNVLIGSVYIILLEKTGGDWAAVASAKRQHFGILAKLNNTDKYSLPWRDQPVRIVGEAEGRAFAANVSPEATADIMELANSPVAQETIGRNILTADLPTRIHDIAPIADVPRGASRSVQYVDHIIGCGGIEFTRE